MLITGLQFNKNMTTGCTGLPNSYWTCYSREIHQHDTTFAITLVKIDGFASHFDHLSSSELKTNRCHSSAERNIRDFCGNLLLPWPHCLFYGYGLPRSCLHKTKACLQDVFICYASEADDWYHASEADQRGSSVSWFAQNWLEAPNAASITAASYGGLCT